MQTARERSGLDPAQWSRLPQYVQGLIRSLFRLIDEAKKRAALSSEDGLLFLDSPYMGDNEDAIYVGDYSGVVEYPSERASLVVFKVDGVRYMIQRNRRGPGLEINAGFGQLSIKPQCGNVVEIVGEK